MRYSRLQEKGGTITPQRGMFLVWTADAAGNPTPRPTSAADWRDAERRGLVHRARSVTIKPHPYMLPAIVESRPIYRELARAEFSEVLMAH